MFYLFLSTLKLWISPQLQRLLVFTKNQFKNLFYEKEKDEYGKYLSFATLRRYVACLALFVFSNIPNMLATQVFFTFIIFKVFNEMFDRIIHHHSFHLFDKSVTSTLTIAGVLISFITLTFHIRQV